MDSSSKFFFSFSVNYAMIVKLVDLIILLGSKLLNRFCKIFNRKHNLRVYIIFGREHDDYWVMFIYNHSN